MDDSLAQSPSRRHVRVALSHEQAAAWATGLQRSPTEVRHPEPDGQIGP